MCSSYIVIVNTNPHFLTAKMATNGDKSSKIKVASNHYWDSAMISGNHQNLTLFSSDCDLSFLMDFREKKKFQPRKRRRDV